MYIEIGHNAYRLEIGQKETTLELNDEIVILILVEMYRLDTVARILQGLLKEKGLEP